jgi:hypothetical protein
MLLKRIPSYIIVMAFLLMTSQSLKGQESYSGLVQFSGLVVSSDSLQPLPFVSIVVKGTYRGTISDYNGFFSFVSRIGDTLEFSAIGYQKGLYIVPDSLLKNRHSVIKIMTRDTILLPETVVFPWPSRSQFKQAFLQLRLPDNDYERAKRNLSLAELRSRMQTLPLDGSGNYKVSIMETQDNLYRAGQYRSISLLNPVAWAKFIEAWQRGDYKRKED